MKKIAITLFIGLGLLTTTTAHAFYQTFQTQGTTLEISVPEVVLGFEDRVQTTVFQPEFKGTADSFALVTVVPGTPTHVVVEPSVIYNLKESSESVEIQTITITTAQGETIEMTPVVSEPQYHDEYEVSFIPTSSIEDLTQWLDEKGYQYQPGDIEAFSGYKDVAYTFVVVYVNTAETAQYNDEGYYGTLSPIAIRFSSVAPYLPLPVMNAQKEDNLVDIEVYTVSPEYFYVPGVDTLYSNQESESSLVTTLNPWVVHQKLTINPSMSVQDLYLNTDDNGYTINRGQYSIRTIHPEFLRSTTGVIAGTSPSIHELVQSFDTLLGGTRLLKYGVQGEDVKELQMFLNLVLPTQLVADGKWGPKTHEAIEQFQSLNNLKVDGIIGSQTRGLIAELLEGK